MLDNRYKVKVGNSRFSDSFVNVLRQRVCMHYIFITHTGSTTCIRLVDHTRCQALDLKVRLPLGEGDHMQYSFLFRFVFMYHVWISAVGQEGSTDVWILRETLPWQRALDVQWVSKLTAGRDENGAIQLQGDVLCGCTKELTILQNDNRRLWCNV